MSYLRLLSYMSLAAVVSWAALVLLIFKVDPKSSLIGLLLFYVSLFFALVTTLSILGYTLRNFFHKVEVYYDALKVSIRQGVLLGLIGVGCVFFQNLRVLNWVSGLLLIGVITLIEFYVVARE